MEEYLTPADTHRFETEVKRSRFITTVGNVHDSTDAKRFIGLVRLEFPDASHHCWAMVAGAPDNVHQRDQSDDGEPRGTAGKPMLNVLQHSGLGNIAVVVTRYYGGVKLGTGGLVRAYTHAVSAALKTLETSTVLCRGTMLADLPYTALASFEHWLKSRPTLITDKKFSHSVRLTMLIAAAEREQVIAKIARSGGTVINQE